MEKLIGACNLMINTKYNQHGSYMLHAKFSPNPFSTSGEGDFGRVLPYMGMVASLNNGFA